MKERSPKERLYWLLKLYKRNEIDIERFCNEFHITYDHESDYEVLNQIEDTLFEDLARSAARFSGNPGEMRCII